MRPKLLDQGVQLCLQGALILIVRDHDQILEATLPDMEALLREVVPIRVSMFLVSFMQCFFITPTMQRLVSYVNSQIP